MTSNVNLLPLPEKVEVDKHLPTGVRIYAYDKNTLKDYARANVEHHTAAQAAEIEALRAEREVIVAEALKYADKSGRLEAKVDRLAEVQRLPALSQWKPIESAPRDGTTVLIHYINCLGNGRTIKAKYLPRFYEESGSDDGEGVDEYDEANDRYTYLEGWWEVIDNWGEFGFVKVHEGEPTHWMMMPIPPREAASA